MCQNTQDEFVLDKLSQDFKKLQKCLKCESASTIVTRVHEAMCKPCFMEYFTHKFRATIGKNRLFDAHEQVLFAYSGSSSSVAMLHLIKQGVSEEAKKKFLFKPILLFIEDSSIYDNISIEQRIDNLNKIRNSVEYSGFPIIYSLIENHLLIDNKDTQLYFDDINQINFNNELSDNLRNTFKSTTTLTSKEELAKRMKMVLISEIAERLKIKKVLLAIDCTKLTITLLSNVAQGKAAHLSSEMNLRDLHLKNVQILKPLRELTSKEIAYYNHNVLKEPVCFDNITTMTAPNSTIYRLTERFIIGLQNNYPTTVSTIFRTSDKFSNPNEDTDEEGDELISCVLCGYNLDTNSNKDNINTLSDVKFSHQLMQNGKAEGLNNEENNRNLHDLLCYSCRLILKDSNNPNAFEKLFEHKKEENLKDSIKDYLLE